MIKKYLLKADRFIIFLILIFVSTIGAMLWHLSYIQSYLVKVNALDTAKQLTIVLREVRSLYASDVIAPASAHGIVITHDTKSKKNSIPLPATFSMQLGDLLARHSGGAKSKLYSPFPFPWRKDTGGLKDSFSKAAWQALSTKGNEPYTQFVQTGSGVELRYAIADRMQSSCIQCHNTHPQSPKTDWKVGDLRGVIEVAVPLNALNAKASLQTGKTAAIYSAIGFFLLIGLVVTFRRLQNSNKILEAKTLELELVNNKLKDLSEVDPLTDIYNRRYYDGRLRSDIAIAKRTMSPISMLLIDIDNFKEYNDKYGHSQGDNALKSVATTIYGSLPREADWVARVGGEEFAVILPSTDIAGANSVAEYIRMNVVKLKMPHLHSAAADTVTVSIGISSLAGPDLEGASLFQKADMALYSAKAGGKNQCRIFDENWAQRRS